MDQPGKVANPARGQLNRENEYPPVRVRACIERIKSIVFNSTAYDGGDPHILDVSATELQQTLETDIYL